MNRKLPSSLQVHSAAWNLNSTAKLDFGHLGMDTYVFFKEGMCPNMALLSYLPVIDEETIYYKLERSSELWILEHLYSL